MWPTARSLSMSFPRSLQILVLLDIMLPELDGFEVCRRIKENAEIRRMPMIILTSNKYGGWNPLWCNGRKSGQ